MDHALAAYWKYQDEAVDVLGRPIRVELANAGRTIFFGLRSAQDILPRAEAYAIINNYGRISFMEDVLYTDRHWDLPMAYENARRGYMLRFESFEDAARALVALRQARSPWLVVENPRFLRRYYPGLNPDPLVAAFGWAFAGNNVAFHPVSRMMIPRIQYYM